MELLLYSDIFTNWNLFQFVKVFHVDRHFTTFRANSYFRLTNSASKKFAFIRRHNNSVSCTFNFYCTAFFHFTSATDAFSHDNISSKFFFVLLLYNYIISYFYPVVLFQRCGYIVYYITVYSFTNIYLGQKNKKPRMCRQAYNSRPISR